ncbi:hypothetical protein AVEN_271426-1 [Araneus ventricosus]|uniref:Uncharacterized protein n=1 Tax=Araneus ventricosus TaxID=182803 RepID=A0A4Y1ZS55_ARAVE|nr:hypothetical protein AVEN_271426-1 [Araneus ventricosus]
MVQLIFQKPDSMVQPSKMVQPFTMFWKLVSANQSKALFNRHFPGHSLCTAREERRSHREKESEVSLRNLISAPTRHPRELATSIPAAVSNGTPRSPPC